MDTKDYNFKVGDIVITTIGEIGHIEEICYCELCAKRGFFEPTWRVENEVCARYITKFDAEHGFDEFYRIGEYRFNEFNKSELYAELASYEKEIKKLRNQLTVIEQLDGEE